MNTERKLAFGFGLMSLGASLIAIWIGYTSLKASRNVKPQIEKPCIDELIHVRGTPDDPVRYACSHASQRIVDRWDANIFLCRCSPEKVYSDPRWVDPIYKQQVEHEMHISGLKHLGEWLDHAPSQSASSSKSESKKP